MPKFKVHTKMKTSNNFNPKCMNFKIFLILIILVIKGKACTSIAEYPLSGLSPSTTSISSSINSSTQPVLRFPSVVNPPSTTNDPVVTNAGLWITPQKYVIPSGIWNQSSTICTEMNMWFFYISGYIGEFVGVGLKMGNTIARYITVSGVQSGSSQVCVFKLGTQSFTLGQILHGWNIISFEMCTDYFRYNICQTSTCYGYSDGYYPGYGNLVGTETLHIGCLNCVGSDISYLIQSVRSTKTFSTCVGNPIPNALPNSYLSCGNAVRESGEGCDDGGVVSGDGCSEFCSVESGWTCTDGSSTSKDVCFNSETCGDGIRFNSAFTYCDDGNIISGDGCSSICSIETGWSCSGGTSTTIIIYLSINTAFICFFNQKLFNF